MIFIFHLRFSTNDNISIDVKLFIFLTNYVEVMPPTTTTTTKSTTEIILPPPITTTRRPRRNKNRRKNRNKRPKEQLQFEQTVEKKDQNGRVIEEVNHISFVINEEKGKKERYIYEIIKLKNDWAPCWFLNLVEKY